jgi:SnoaL-like domain
MAAELERIARVEARLAIEDLNTDFCHYLDHDDIAHLLDLFTEDACYSHGSRVSTGLIQVRALFDRRSANGIRTARHMYSGLKVNLLTADRATGQSVCMTFARDSAPPITPAIPYLVADFIDEYIRCSDGRWRIAKRHIERIFVDPANPGPVGQ